MSDWTHLYSTKKWTQLREAKLTETPFCHICQTTLNLHVDHIKDHKGNLTLFYDYENLQVLCREHHTQKTRLDQTILQYKMGGWTLEISKETDLQIDYICKSFYNNRWKALTKIASSLLTNPFNIKVRTGTLTLGDIRYLVHEIIKMKKSYPTNWKDIQKKFIE